MKSGKEAPLGSHRANHLSFSPLYHNQESLEKSHPEISVMEALHMSVLTLNHKQVKYLVQSRVVSFVKVVRVVRVDRKVRGVKVR